MSRRKFNSIVANARREAFAIVEREMKKALPRGWTAHLAVGWGLTIFDENHRAVVGAYANAPARMPKGMRKASVLAADFCDTFGYGNEAIHG